MTPTAYLNSLHFFDVPVILAHCVYLDDGDFELLKNPNVSVALNPASNMKDGIVQQIDTPQNLYNNPCNLFVAGFIGSPQMNFMMSTEALKKVRVGYADPCDDLKDLSRTYREAAAALEVGRIFYKGDSVFAYGSLGIGRLIHSLPAEPCRLFLKEIFGENGPRTFDQETITTINAFFDNNLNISETARQLYVHRNTLVYRLEKLNAETGLDIRTFDDALTFKIAAMVIDYLNSKENVK